MHVYPKTKYNIKLAADDCSEINGYLRVASQNY